MPEFASAGEARIGATGFSVGGPESRPAEACWSSTLADPGLARRHLVHGAPMAAPTIISLHPGMPAPDLDAWLAERQLGNWRNLPVSMLSGRFSAQDKAWLKSQAAKDRNLGDIITSKSRRSSFGTPRNEAGYAIQIAAIAYLEDRLTARHRAEAAEPAVLESLSVPTPDAELRPVQARLLALRAQVRTTVPARDTATAEQSLSLATEARSMVVVERVFATCGRRTNPTITLALEPLGAEPAIRCDCVGGAGGRCGVGLAAIDTALRILVGQGSELGRAQIRKIVSEPRWASSIAAIDEALAPREPKTRAGATSPTTDGLLLGWRCTFVSDGTPDVTLVGLRERAKKGSTTPAITLVAHDVQALRYGRVRPMLAVDLEIARTLPLEAHYRQTVTEQSLHRRALALLVGHPRVFHGRTGARPLAVVRAGLVLHLRATSNGGFRLELTVGGRLMRASELYHCAFNVPPEEDLVVYDEAEGLCSVVATRVGLVQLLAALVRVPTEQAADALPLWLVRLPALARVVDIEIDPSLRGEPLPAETAPFLRLEILPGPRLSAQLLVRPLPGGAPYPPGEGPEDVYGEQGTRPVFVHRDLEAEREVAEATLAHLELDPGFGDAPAEFDSMDGGLEFLERLRTLEPPVPCEWQGGVGLRITRPATGRDLRLRVASKRDWFGLEGELEIDGAHVAMSALLAAVRDGRRFVPADDGAIVMLDALLRDGLAALANVAGAKGALSASQIPLVERLEALGAAVDVPKAWAELTRRARAATAFEPPAPQGLETPLRDYQLQGFHWMARLAEWAPGCCLADDMGLGKTVQSLALLLHRAAAGPALVVAPTSLGFNWVREAGRFAPSLRVLAYRDTDRGDVLRRIGPSDVLCVSYDLMVRDAERLAARHFVTVIFDEAHTLKNAESLRSMAAAGLDAAFRVALTGTPVENRVAEIWAVMRAAVPGLLGAASDFRERFVLPIERDADSARRKTLAALLAPFLLRRTKAEVVPELPPRTDITVRVPLSRAERRMYEERRLATLAALSSGGELRESQRRVQVLAALTQLRQLVCHPRLVEPTSDVPSSKLQHAIELIAEVRSEGHRPLVFSQFTRFLALVREALLGIGLNVSYLDGSTPAGDRERIVDGFQAGEGDAFLLSLKAGGAGLNLTAATYVIHLDPWWNPAVEDQATGRAHRIGQMSPVTVYRLAAEGTIEEAILALHEEKRELVAALLEGTGAAGKLSSEELVALMERASAQVDETDETESSESSPEAAVAVRAALRRESPATDGPAMGFDRRAAMTRFAQVLEADLSAKRLRGRATVSAYLAAMERLFDYAGQKRLPLSAPEIMAEVFEDCVDAIEAGTFDGPASFAVTGRTAVRRFISAQQGAGAPVPSAPPPAGSARLGQSPER